ARFSFLPGTAALAKAPPEIMRTIRWSKLSYIMQGSMNVLNPLRRIRSTFGRVAAETAKMMRWIDPTLTLAACGSTSRTMPTFGRWNDEALDHTFELIDFVSLHTYLNNYAGDTAAFLASPDVLDSFIEEVVAIADAVAARRRSPKRLMLTLDEWNVWYRPRRKR